jgi:hypothetical protein
MELLQSGHGGLRRGRGVEGINDALEAALAIDRRDLLAGNQLLTVVLGLSWVE